MAASKRAKSGRLHEKVRSLGRVATAERSLRACVSRRHHPDNRYLCGLRSNSEETNVRKYVRRRYWCESVCAVLAFALALLTLISREWIEELFGVDPDGGSGAFEWLIVIGLLLITVASTVAARYEVTRARRLASAA
jgi:hypothetical protein